jgi:hypothetical protein
VKLEALRTGIPVHLEMVVKDLAQLSDIRNLFDFALDEDEVAESKPEVAPGAYPTKSYKYWVTDICNYTYL